MHLTLQRNALRREFDTVEGAASVSMCLTDRVGSRYRQTETGSCRVFAKETGEEISLVRDAVRVIWRRKHGDVLID